jgi:hypothetical protein
MSSTRLYFFPLLTPLFALVPLAADTPDATGDLWHPEAGISGAVNAGTARTPADSRGNPLSPAPRDCYALRWPNPHTRARGRP